MPRPFSEPALSLAKPVVEGNGVGVTRRQLLLAAAVAPLLVAGCGRPESSTAPAATQRVSTTDLAGAVVELGAPATRVVAIPIPAASMLVAVNGSPDILVGMNSSAQTAIKDGYLGEVYPQLTTVASGIAGEDFAPSIERIVGLAPDVVIQWGDEGVAVVEPLSAAGLTVAQLKYGTQEFLEGAVLLYGELLGKQDRAQRIVTGMHDTRAELQAAAPTGGDRPTVLYLRSSDQGLMAAGKANYLNTYLGLAGGVNPAAGLPGAQAGVGPEQILAWDPDIVLLSNFDKATPQAFSADPVWAGLSAVRDKRVYKIPLGGYRWDPPNQESPLMWRWTAGIVGAGEVPAGLRGTIRREFEFLYNNSPTDAQLDKILRNDLNSGSVGYGNPG